MSHFGIPGFWKKSALLIVIFYSTVLLSQASEVDTSGMDTTFSLKPKLLIPQNYDEWSVNNFKLHYLHPQLPTMYSYTPARIAMNPWEIDTRSGSFYTPRMVRDELNLIMNRPRDQAFVPILGVAYIAYQMASKYLIIKKKMEVNPDNVLSCCSDLEILEALWQKSPQTSDMLYEKENIAKKYTFQKLETALERMSDENLIKSKQPDDGETLYFPGIKKSTLEDVLESAKKDSLRSSVETNRIDSLLIYFRTPR